MGPDKISRTSKHNFVLFLPCQIRIPDCNAVVVSAVMSHLIPFGISALNVRFYAYGFTDAKVLAKKMVAS